MNGIELKRLRLEREITQKELSEATGVAQSTIGRYEASGKDIAKSVTVTALEKFFKNGDQARKSNPRLEADPLKLSINPLDVEGDKSKFFELPDGSIAMQVPIIPYKAFAGYLHGFQDQEYYEDLDTIMIGVDKRHAGDYLAFEVKGDSMVTYEPELNSKSIHPGRLAVGRFLAKDKWRSKLHIGANDAWIIVHKTEGILIKNIIAHKVEEGVITIHSLNPDKNIYPDEDLHLEDVEQIFDVLQVVDKRR